MSSDKEWTKAEQMDLQHPPSTAALYETIGKVALTQGHEAIVEAGLTYPAGMPLPSNADVIQTLAVALVDATDAIAALCLKYGQTPGYDKAFIDRVNKRFLRTVGVLTAEMARKETLTARCASADTSKVN